MSAGFQGVQWNTHKRVYDALLIGFVLLYLGAFTLLAPLVESAGPPSAQGHQPVTPEITQIRATGTCAFLMLTIILTIGPLARLDRRFLPLLYNRRHFGVLTFLVALLHAYLVLAWYHSIARLPPLISILVSNSHYGSFTQFPFEALGILALLILFLMAVTSHDFWLAFLTPPVWKVLHMFVYVAFALVVMHVALGAMQTERSIFLPALLFAAVGTVSYLHRTAGRIEQVIDHGDPEAAGWLVVPDPLTVQDGRARIVVPEDGERIAVFRNGDKFHAVQNVCAHQNGPLGEGRIIDGCITCPWHGFQFRPEDGRSPPPFEDMVATHRLRAMNGLLWVDPVAQPPGTALPPVLAADLTASGSNGVAP